MQPSAVTSPRKNAECNKNQEVEKMKRKYFINEKTVQELKKSYKDLLKKYHPDNGGDLATMQEINAEYDFLVKILPDVDLDEDQRESTSDFDGSKVSEILKAVIDAVARIPGISAELCGSWVWVSGNTFPVKDQLKALGFLFSGKKKMWYFREVENKDYHHFRGRREADMSEIRTKYGSETVQHRAAQALA